MNTSGGGGSNPHHPRSRRASRRAPGSASAGKLCLRGKRSYLPACANISSRSSAPHRKKDTAVLARSLALRPSAKEIDHDRNDQPNKTDQKCHSAHNKRI